MEVISVDNQATNKIKEKIWKVATTPKIRFFMWRALSGALAIADCLRRHGVNVPPICQLCNGASETVSHVLFECIIAQQVWLSTGLPLWPVYAMHSVSERFAHLLKLMERQDLDTSVREAIPWLLWEIWKARNSTLYAAKTNSPQFIVATALEEAREWLQQNLVAQQDRSRSLNHFSTGERRWSKPAPGKLKCNIHSSWIRDSFHIGGAWLLRNHLGEAVFHARDAFLPMVNRLAAELHIILWCV
ncbi:uncharacterized protein LOC110230882 [Arabidopsis lyrata subsp. lyrata]|uniref:uncharacterized protein LOC110230882 n=1 Tax=Arabidopsis lyrata subsp. lyrata TaxID=81972 RepID=UPI000A29D742|nr:uncharacterized protein LOC110230882 [Arabidopsis lyrata subsp. lyrata]|eukprot:XP_020890746.1 uncharacterized protein LOC110230882 [Arabidopsis lyrata subsp. lyrata]